MSAGADRCPEEPARRLLRLTPLLPGDTNVGTGMATATHNQPDRRIRPGVWSRSRAPVAGRGETVTPQVAAGERHGRTVRRRVAEHDTPGETRHACGPGKIFGSEGRLPGPENRL
jgi:hypothetical protein